MDDAEAARDLRRQCTRFVAGHGHVTAEMVLADLPTDTEFDRYGDGGVVQALENRVAGLLGKPAAVFVPSGTMAQQATLRVHADRRGRRTVVSHPTCHLLLHEDNAMTRLHDLVGRAVGSRDRLLTLDDLTAVAEPVAALLIELPQREIGGQLPTLDDLGVQLDWARERGAATHLDGARLWEAAAAYSRPVDEIAALFDTVYVSFYKGIGALPGCCVAGADDVIAEVREWRKRMGGTLFGMWPNAASAMTCLDRRLPRMTTYVDTARELAGALRGRPGMRLVPDPPQTNMMHLLLEVTADDFVVNARRLATEEKIWTWPKAMPTLDPQVQRVELSVGDATLEWDVPELANALAALV
ncbi:MAG TPA: beta-eliminating lyase-related protein [Mycobacteriales bacterium]|nr:beta-eliminating lyase-related protein [Mycobacteriales bacterium]